MCGIAGIVDQRQSYEVLHSNGEKMLAALSHRGPDSNGLWVNRKASLLFAHTRLAIQDLTDLGKQPMVSKSGRYCIVFNGEIYNFRELTRELQTCGHSFSGHSDTEVLLGAIEEWGVEKALTKLTGMFAFALWDENEGMLQLCRDRMGEKPLYYGWLDKTFYFASELKAIEQVAAKESLEINADALGQYLQYGYISAPYSIYEGLYKLPPGTILSLPYQQINISSEFNYWPDCSGYGPKSYWRIIDAVNKGLNHLITDEHAAIENLEQLLNSIVRSQLIADVRVGLFLSGGIDSSIVSAIAQSQSTDKIRTYTIGFQEKEYDESGYAEKIAKHLGTDHQTLYLKSRDALDCVPGISSIYDEPFADSSQIPAYLVSKMARNHVTVCLSGDGGDELFAGYNRYLWQHGMLGKLFALPVSLRKQLGKLLSLPKPGFWDGMYKGTVGVVNLQHRVQTQIGLKMQKISGLIQQGGLEQAYDYLSSYWIDPQELLSVKYGCSTEKYEHNMHFTNYLDQSMFLDQMRYLPGDNLVKVDRASMSVGLETRLPLLSHELVEFSWKLPHTLKYKNKTTKWALRQVLYKYVPKNLVDRPKMGFSVPVAQWLRSDLKDWAEDLLSDIESRTNGLLKERPVRKAWTDHLTGKMDNSHRLWTVLMFMSWSRSRIWNR